MADQRIRLGMVGGGKDAFIGAVHRIASRIDDQYEFVAGALSSTPEKAQASGAELGLAPDRIYDDFNAMAEAEAARADGVEAVAIVTPNHMHAAPAIAFLQKGIHVICDKPLTATMEDAAALAEAVRASDALFVLTHNYTGYPMIRQAREMIAAGQLGRIRVVQAEYPQDWLSRDLESSGQKQAGWRTDPARSGAGGCVGDIGTHAFNLANFVTGLRCSSLAADLTTFVDGRQLDDNVQVLLRFEGGAKGMLWASQVAAGNENGLRATRTVVLGEPLRRLTRGGPGTGEAAGRMRVYGADGGLEWRQEEPCVNYLWYAPLGEPLRRICSHVLTALCCIAVSIAITVIQGMTRGGPGTLYPACHQKKKTSHMTEAAEYLWIRMTRIPNPGHPI